MSTPYRTLVEETMAKAATVHQRIAFENATEDVRSATALLAKLATESDVAEKQGRQLEGIVKVAHALSPDLHWDGSLIGGRVADGLLHVAGSALRSLNNLAKRRDEDIARAEKKLAKAQIILAGFEG